MTPQERLGFWIAATSIAAIALATLYPLPGAPPSPASFCILCGQYGARDAILNILLFLPLGAGLRLARLRTSLALAAMALLTTTVELLQYAVIPGRDASVGDVLMNVLGGAVGLWLGARWMDLVLPRPRLARRLALSGSVALALLLAASAWGVGFAGASAKVYWGQWAHRFVRRAPFLGRIVEARVAGLPLPDAALVRTSGDVRARLASGDVRLDATVIPAGPTPREAPILTVTDGYFVELLTFEQDGRDLVFGAHMRASELLLGSPRIRIPTVFPASAESADTMRLAGALRDGRFVARAAVGRAVIERELRLGPWSGWSFVAPFSAAFGAPFAWITAAWAFGLVLPIGYWIARGAVREGTRAVGGRAALALAPALGIALVELTDGVPSDAAALLSAAAGLACGWLLGRWSVRGTAAEEVGASCADTAGPA